MRQGDLGHDPAVVHFIAVAKDYCRILESELVPLNRDLVQRLLEVIVALYTAGLKLPEVDPDRQEHEDRAFDGDSRHKFFRSVAERLGDDVFYQMVFDPLDKGECKPVTASLSDDLADIYFDVKEGLMRIPEAGPVPAHVIWAWAFGLEIHWGRHAVNAIGALHSLLFGAHALS
jgi:hypothetical protein